MAAKKESKFVTRARARKANLERGYPLKGRGVSAKVPKTRGPKDILDLPGDLAKIAGRKKSKAKPKPPTKKKRMSTGADRTDQEQRMGITRGTKTARGRARAKRRD